MDRIATIVHRSTVAVILASTAFSTIGCTSVRENRVNMATGQVETVNRHQFFVKSIFNRNKDRVTYVQPQSQQQQQQPALAMQQPMMMQNAQPQYVPQNYANAIQPPAQAPMPRVPFGQ
jgi:hypothetical protein